MPTNSLGKIGDIPSTWVGLCIHPRYGKHVLVSGMHCTCQWMPPLVTPVNLLRFGHDNIHYGLMTTNNFEFDNEPCLWEKNILDNT